MCHACFCPCIFVYACLLQHCPVCIFPFFFFFFNPVLLSTVFDRISSCSVSVLSQAIFKPCSFHRASSPLPHFGSACAAMWTPCTARAICFPSQVPLLWWIRPPSCWNVCRDRNISHRQGNFSDRPCVCIRGRAQGTHWDVICAILAWDIAVVSASKSFPAFLFLSPFAELIHPIQDGCLFKFNILQI